MILTKGREYYEADDGFKETNAEKSAMSEMKNKNSVIAYWSKVKELSIDETKEIAKDAYRQAIKDGRSKEDAKMIAEKRRSEESISSPRDIDDIRQFDIIQRYNHKTHGEIYVINTNRHYQLYKEMNDGKNVRLVSESSFRATTINVMREMFKNTFGEFEPIEIWKKDASSILSKKKNISLIMATLINQESKK